MQEQDIERFTSSRPCPICGGHKDLPAGQGTRCYGLMDASGRYARCTREECAGALEQNSDGTYSHRLEGPCHCGADHDDAPPPPATQNGSFPTVRHDVRSPTGELVGVHARRGSGAGKKVWWEGLGDTKPVDLLYRAEVIAETPADSPIVLCEGEPATDAAASLGLVAVGTVCGAHACISPEAAAMLAGREVWCWPDADNQGHAHMERNAAALRVARAKVSFVNWPDAPPKGDAADFAAAGGTAAAVADLVDSRPPPGPYIDWKAFWVHEEHEDPWIIEGILARGRGHSIYAKHKTGKSLLSLWMALAAIDQGAIVIYLDYEMTEDDLRERLEDMGCGSETDLNRLRYAFAQLPPLDTKEGGEALMGLVDAEKASHPGVDVVVVIDTIGRAVEGEENPADTIRAFYFHTGAQLKRRGVTFVRLDHAGWEGQHARGSSAKGDDVDVIWKLLPVEGGLKLQKDGSRMGWVPHEVVMHMEDNPLRFVQVDEIWPSGTTAMAELLDKLGVSIDATVRPTIERLREGDHPRKREVVAAGLKWRRMGSWKTAQSGWGTPVVSTSGGTEGHTYREHLGKGVDLQEGNTLGEHLGTPSPTGKGTLGVSRREHPREPVQLGDEMEWEDYAREGRT